MNEMSDENTFIKTWHSSVHPLQSPLNDVLVVQDILQVYVFNRSCESEVFPWENPSWIWMLAVRAALLKPIESL